MKLNIPNQKPKSRVGQSFSQEFHEELIASVARLSRFGYTQNQIKGKLEAHYNMQISQRIISGYLKIIRERYKRASVEEHHIKIQECLDIYRDIKQEAYEALQKSKLPQIEIQKERGLNGRGYVDKILKTKTKRLPEATYMRIIMECTTQERELLGLDPVKKVRNETLLSQIPWDEFAKVEEEDEIGTRIQNIILEQQKTQQTRKKQMLKIEHFS